MKITTIFLWIAIAITALNFSHINWPTAVLCGIVCFLLMKIQSKKFETIAAAFSLTPKSDSNDKNDNNSDDELKLARIQKTLTGPGASEWIVSLKFDWTKIQSEILKTKDVTQPHCRLPTPPLEPVPKSLGLTLYTKRLNRVLPTLTRN